MNEQVCGVCGDPADVIARVPMCGERGRYPMCMDCFVPVEEAGYVEHVEMLPGPDEAQ